MSWLPGKLGIVATAAVVLVVLAASYLVARTPDELLGGQIVAVPTAPSSSAAVPYTLKSGASAKQVGAELEGLGIIPSAGQFELLVTLMGVQDKLSAGDYLLGRDSSALKVVNQITVKAAVPVLKVTFPEGIRIEEMAAIAEKAGFGTQQQFLEAAATATLPPDLAATKPEGQGMQGYLFPDTYILPVGSTAADLVRLMVATLDKRFTPELRAAALAHGLNPHQTLTMAAIVEREAALAQERPLIAAVFYNRLDAGDKLGADPTTQFAATINNPAGVAKFGWWKKELSIDDLESRSPYNTRLAFGLPPGPITNPGLASIEAVANPEKTDYYYFVADAKKGDGSHVFAVTLADHERNVARVGAP